GRVGAGGRAQLRQVDHRALRRGQRRCWRGAAEPLPDPAAHVAHAEAARVDLPRLPLGVSDHRALVPAVVPAHGGGRALDGLELGGRPGVFAVAEVLALEAVEVPVAIHRRLVVGGQRAFGDDRAEDVVVAQAGVVGAAVADEVDAAVLGDHTVAERAGQTAVAALADAHRPGDAPGDGVVDHHAVHRAEGALVVAVVVAPVAYLDDGEPLSDQSVQKRLRGHG